MLNILDKDPSYRIHYNYLFQLSRWNVNSSEDDLDKEHISSSISKVPQAPDPCVNTQYGESGHSLIKQDTHYTKWSPQEIDIVSKNDDINITFIEPEFGKSINKMHIPPGFDKDTETAIVYSEQ